MKIVTWNCNGGLRKKSKPLDAMGADLYVIQECEDPSQSTKQFRDWAGNYLWCGGGKNKGIGIFARNGNQIQKLKWEKYYTIPGSDPKDAESASWHTNELKEFLSVRVNDSFNMLAVWTKQSEGGTFGYAGQLWRYLQSHQNDIEDDDCMILGDLNSNVRWDRPDRWWNHSDNVRIIENLGLQSLYHDSKGIEQGNEPDPTFYLYRKKDRAYHIDYIFASKALIRNYQFRCHKGEKWLEYSDHVPLEVTLDQAN